MKSAAKNHPTGLSLIIVTALVAIARQLGLDISEDTAYVIVIIVGTVVSALSPRFKSRFGKISNELSPVINCIDSNLSDEKVTSQSER